MCNAGVLFESIEPYLAKHSQKKCCFQGHRWRSLLNKLILGNTIQLLTFSPKNLLPPWCAEDRTFLITNPFIGPLFLATACQISRRMVHLTTAKRNLRGQHWFWNVFVFFGPNGASEHCDCTPSVLSDSLWSAQSRVLRLSMCLYPELLLVNSYVLSPVPSLFNDSHCAAKTLTLIC